MANLNNSKSVYTQMAGTAAPKWVTPRSLKRSYHDTLATHRAYDALINPVLRQYGNIQPLQRTVQYRNLVNSYNRAYAQNALAASRQARTAVARDAAGYGNTYTSVATGNALNQAMARKGEAIPALMAAAQKAYRNDKNSKEQTIAVLRAQKGLQTDAAKDLFYAQQGEIMREADSKQQAHAAMQKALGTLFNTQLSYEKVLEQRRLAKRQELEKERLAYIKDIKRKRSAYQRAMERKRLSYERALAKEKF